MAKSSGPPKVKRRSSEPSSALLSDELRVLGVTLSKSLPTYDIPIDLVAPNNFNANEMNDPTFNRLVQEMEETGMIDPIQVVPAVGGKFVIIGGEHRWAGARSLGYETIPCHILTDEKFLDEKLQKLLSVRLNVIKGKMNPEKFTALYEEMAKEYGTEQLQALFGFTESDAWKKLVKGAEDALTKTGVGGPALAAEMKRRSKKVKTVDGLSSVLNSLFKKYGNDLENNFMVFVFGGKEHLYVIADGRVQSALEEIKEACREGGLDINEVLAPAIEDAAERIKRDV